MRPVEWESEEVASQVLAADLRHAQNRSWRFPSRAQAAEHRLESFLKGGRDPGQRGGGRPVRWQGNVRGRRKALDHGFLPGASARHPDLVNRDLRALAPGDLLLVNEGQLPPNWHGGMVAEFARLVDLRRPVA